MNCPKCGQPLPDDSEFCQYCGSKLAGPAAEVNSAVPASAPELAGKTCPFCKAPFMEGEAVVFCSHCEMPHHLECWKENSGCTTFGCTGNIGRIIGAEQRNAQSAPVATRKPAEAPKTIPYPQTRTREEIPMQAERSAPAAPPRPAPVAGGTVLAENTDKVLQGNLPILLEKTNLRKDSDGKLSVVCSFRSLANKAIQAMQVDVKCADIWRENVEGVEGHQYLDLMISRNGVFGEEESIPIPDSNTRVVDVLVQKIMFSDGTLLLREGDNVKISEPISLTSTLGEELFEEYKSQTYPNARFEPTRIGAFWRCTCGEYNREEEGDCHFCGDSLATLTSHLNKGMLQSSVDEKKRLQQEKEERERIAREEALRLQREREERERREREEQLRIQREREAAEAAERRRIAEEKAKADAEAARIRAEQRKKRNRKIAIFSSAAAVLALIVYLAGWQIIPSARYKKADAAIAAGNYELAYEQFSKNHGYKDSPIRAAEARYAQAEAALESKDYDTAYQYYSEIPDYSDSETKAKEALYQKATRLMEEESYADAQEIFTQISGYKDSTSMINTCRRAAKYTEAEALFADGKFEASASAFDEIEYLDSKNRAQEAYYFYAKQLLEQGKLHDAYLILKEKVNNRSTPYEDAAELAVQAEYQYASDCFEADKYEAAYASFANTKGYEDSDSQYLEAGYQYGLQLFEQKSYEKAATVFESLDKYKDSVTQANESKYQQALALMGKKQYSQAEKLFEELGRYSDSAKQLLEIKYQRAMSLVKERKYTQAVPLFKELGNYSDSLEQWKSAMWSYVLAHKNNDDKTTYEYLTALKRYNYKDSKTYYDSLYTWRATIKVYTSSSSSSPVSSFSRYQQYVRVEWKITGGAPGEIITVREYSQWPGWYCDENRVFVYDGYSYSYHWDDFDATGAGTYVIKLYNKTNGGIIATTSIRVY